MPKVDPNVLHHPAVVEQFQKRANRAYQDLNTLLIENTTTQGRPCER